MATIEIDGKTVEVDSGKMIIEIADEMNIHIPRFCYHKKLSIAANCRMCLVELEGSKKTVPACATPVTDGMKIHTQSELAKRSQQAVMDFLLINHPLDCPICDQGGECELQDVSVGYGHSSGTYEETKRAVANDDLGPLVATEMTRCIHCTRCVRFGEEIAGVRELGGIGRGDHTQISTYVEHTLVSEISGNIIDLCPVGALTSKPYRFSARPWELKAYEGIAPHDCLGSNVYFHVRRNELMRVVPRENESINEMWLSDRDRFSYLGLAHPSRALFPKIKQNGEWIQVDWTTALNAAAEGLSRVIESHGPEQLGALASSHGTVEEYYLFQKMMRALGVHNIDHRLQQVDLRDDAVQPLMPTSTLKYAALERQSFIWVFGCQLIKEVPLAGVRLRKAQKNGAVIHATNPVQDDWAIPLDQMNLVSPLEFVTVCETILKALSGEGAHPLAEALRQEKAVIVTGALIENHPDAALLRSLVQLICQKSGAKWLRFTVGANSAGAWAAGMIPHRSVAGHEIEQPGLTTQAMLEKKMKGYCLLGFNPSLDIANAALVRKALLSAEYVVLLSAYQDDAMLEYADVILPIGQYAETSGTYVNVDLTWQTAQGAITPPGEARPAWKVLRVLANLFHLPHFEYTSSEEVLNEVRREVLAAMPKGYSDLVMPQSILNNVQYVRVGEWSIYNQDEVVRHSEALQQSVGSSANVRVHPSLAKKFKLSDVVTVSQGEIEITLPVMLDEQIADDVVWVANALPETIDLGHTFAAIEIKSTID